MEQQHPAGFLPHRRRLRPLDAEDLPRCDEEHDPLVEVVRLLAVPDLAADVFLQRDEVKVEHPPAIQVLRQQLHGGVVHDADERVLRRRQLPAAVKFGDGLDALDGGHWRPGWRGRFQT